MAGYEGREERDERDKGREGDMQDEKKKNYHKKVSQLYNMFTKKRVTTTSLSSFPDYSAFPGCACIQLDESD